MDTSKLDPTKISVISAKKANPEKLIQFGDRATDVPEAVKENATKCSLCCALSGMMISGILIPILTATQTRMAIMYHSNVKYTTQGILRHAGWLALPGVTCASTLHFFMSESMWSQKRHSFSQAWVRAAAVNTLMWCSGIAISTFVWRKILPNVVRLRPLYFRYPVPSLPVDVRLISSPDQFWSGMGWSYFLLGVFHGQLGFLACVGFCVTYNRTHYFMSPHGSYARSCMPLSQREYIERSATAQNSAELSGSSKK